MKSRDGFAAVIIIFVILALVVIGAIAYVHYVYLPQMAAQNSSVPAISTTSTPSALTSSTAATSTIISTTTSHQTPGLNNPTNGWLTFKDSVSGLFILYPPRYTAQRKTIIGTSGEVDVYLPSSPSKNLVSISYGPIGKETSQDAFNTVLMQMPSIQKIYPSFTYSTSTMEILGKFPAQVILMSGSGQAGAIYFFTGSQFIYQITEDYSADASLSTTAAKNLEDNIVSTVKING